MLGNTADGADLGYFQDLDFAGDLGDFKSGLGWHFVHLRNSNARTNYLDGQEANCSLTLFH